MLEHSHEDTWLNSVKELQIGRIYVFQEDNDPRYKAEANNKDLYVLSVNGELVSGLEH